MKIGHLILRLNGLFLNLNIIYKSIQPLPANTLKPGFSLLVFEPSSTYKSLTLGFSGAELNIGIMPNPLGPGGPCWPSEPTLLGGSIYTYRTW